jgi:F-type H+-transporting ATPase subunit delta
MASHAKVAQQLARKLFKLSLQGGEVSPERVGGVLAYVEKHNPANPVMVLKAYRRLIAAEVAKGVAVVEHAGAVNNSILSAIVTAMTRKYERRVSTETRENPALIAGIRVRIGDDVYDSSIAGQLSALASAT